MAFAGSGLVTMRSPSWHRPLPWPLCLGRCEILIASQGTGLFLSVVSDQNTILSCKYNYVGGQGGRVDGRGKGAAREGGGGRVCWRRVEWGLWLFFNRLSPVS